MEMQERTPTSLHQSYIPGVPIVRATLKHSLNRLPIMNGSDPEQVCGQARRIGYSGKDDRALALYRLKIRTRHGLPMTMLPGFYIIEDGIFQDYDLWRQEHPGSAETNGGQRI